MAKTRVGINGFGRIGRNFFRAHLERGGDFEIVAANDLGDAEDDGAPAEARLDARHSRRPGRGRRRRRSASATSEIKFLSERDPAELPWGELGIDVAIESTGFFTKREGAQKHLDAGAKKVVISAPATDPDVTIVLGVNDKDYDPEQHDDHLERVVHDELRRAAREGAPRGVHDRARLHDDDPRVHERPAHARPAARGPAARARGGDQPHPDVDRRRARDRRRAARPEGQDRRHVDARAGADRLDRRSRRAGVARDERRTRSTALFQSKADTGDLTGILQYTDEPLVSTDIVHSSYSSIFDSELTMVNGNLVKVFGWYDNEWGYSCRLVDLVAKIAKTMPAAVAA